MVIQEEKFKLEINYNSFHSHRIIKINKLTTYSGLKYDMMLNMYSDKLKNLLK